MKNRIFAAVIKERMQHHLSFPRKRESRDRWQGWDSLGSCSLLSQGHVSQERHDLENLFCRQSIMVNRRWITVLALE